MTPPPKDIMQEKIVTVLWNKWVRDSQKPGFAPCPRLSSNPVLLPPKAGDPPRELDNSLRHGLDIPYQPGEESEAYHRDDLRHEQSVHAGRRRGCECTRFSLSFHSCSDKIALNDSASPTLCLIAINIYFQRQFFQLSFCFMVKYFHQTSVHVSSTGGRSFARAGQLKSLANSTRLLRGRLTRHGEGLCPPRLCGMCWILKFSYDLTTADSRSS